MSAIRRARHPRSLTGVTNISYGRAANSFDAIARPISPPLASSSAGTAEGVSPSNHGTARKSDSTLLRGAPEQAMTDEVVAEGIRLLSLMLLAAPSARRYNQCSQPPLEDGS